jgi:uncharacterized membrane-anchored protein
MKTVLKVGVIAVAQLALVAVAVAPQLSARLIGESYVLRVAPLDPIDPFRGAYVALDYPDLRQPDQQRDQWDRSPGMGTVDDNERGDVYITLRQEGEVWVSDGWQRERPGDGPYLACTDQGWNVRCGIESYFLPQDEAAAMEREVADGAYAEIRIDSRGNAAVVEVRATP